MGMLGTVLYKPLPISEHRDGSYILSCLCQRFCLKNLLMSLLLTLYFPVFVRGFDPDKQAGEGGPTPHQPRLGMGNFPGRLVATDAGVIIYGPFLITQHSID